MNGVAYTDGRIPYGMRGLKSKRIHPRIKEDWSHPIRDAWIEITKSGKRYEVRYVASHTGCVD